MTFEEYIQSLQGKQVAVIGIGVSNIPLIKLFLRKGIAVTACDKMTGRPLAMRLCWTSWRKWAPC